MDEPLYRAIKKELPGLSRWLAYCPSVQNVDLAKSRLTILDEAFLPSSNLPETISKCLINSNLQTPEAVVQVMRQAIVESLGRMKTATSILITDDDDFNVKIVKRFVQRDGYTKIYTAVNGQDALNLYKDHSGKIDIVLMDNDMPILNGIAATKLILEYSSTLPDSRTKVVGITGNVHEDQLKGCLDAGMITVLKKPATMEELSTVMLSCLFGS
jgi:CheY-like chemotaxis protein